MPRTLNDSWQLALLHVPNRVVLAPLAGIGNWFVRLQAKRYGAGMVVSEMVSSFGVHHGNEKTTTEMLRIEPAERANRVLDERLGARARADVRRVRVRVHTHGAQRVLPARMAEGEGIARVLRDGDRRRDHREVLHRRREVPGPGQVHRPDRDARRGHPLP